MIKALFKSLFDVFLSKLPFKVYFYGFLILIALGAFFWFRYSIYAECKSDVQAQANAESVKVLENKLQEAVQYQEFLLNNQKKNEDFIARQKRELKNANEKDGDVAPVLRGTFDRLRNDRTD